MMPNRINTHAFESGVCTFCKCLRDSPESAKSCDWRDAPPRPVPVSVFADLGSIGDRLKEIVQKEGRPIIAALAMLLLTTRTAGAQEAPILPDSSSPGLVASTDEKDVCGKVNGLTYTKRHRSGTVERSLHCPKGWEADHRVPLAAGGADDPRNLWCEPPGTPWGWKVKDRLDVYAWRAVCIDHSVPLTEAQGWFLAPDWRVAYCRNFDDPACAER